MYIIKNAFKNLYRNSGRNLLLAAITVLIISLSCIGLVIYNNTKTISNDYKSKLSSEVIMDTDYEALDKELLKNPDFIIPETPNEVIHKIAKSKYLQKTEYYSSMEAIADDIKYPVDVPKRDSVGVMAGKKEERMRVPQYVVKGYSDVRNDKGFINKDRSIVKGTFPEKDTDCLISDTIANLNNLKVGDKIKVKNVYYKNSKGEDIEEIPLTISGIYHTKNRDEAVDVDHTIFVNYKILTNEKYVYEQSLKANFFLKSPKDLDAFSKEAYKLGFSKLYKLSTDEVAYESFVQPIEQMSRIALIFIVVILVLGSSVLMILSILAVRERKYEISVLRSMGMKKSKIAAQMIIEALFLTAICIVIGIIIGSIFTQPITDIMLKSSMTSGSNGGFMSPGSSMGSLATSNSAITNIDAKLSLSTIVQLIMISLGLVTISGLVSSYYAMKYEPMKILRERN